MTLPRFLLLLFGSGLLAFPTPAVATIDWLPIGDPGNSGDSQPQGSFGAVDYTYSISKFETTNSEYAEFLNAKAAADPYGLFNPSMESDTHGGIERSGMSGNYVYTVKSGFEDEAVNFVSFFDALRFANWLANGQGNGDTETGSYTLLGGTAIPSNGATVQRNAGATVVVPEQDEWFKAAYYDGTLVAYYDYPTASDTAPTCSSPTATPNRANCGSSTRGVTVVGAYTASASAYGTFDQGGNVAEWNENPVPTNRRNVRGGGWTGLTTPLKASSAGSFPDTTENNTLGFRLALLAGSGGDPLDIEEIALLKFIERFDGMLFSNPFLFESCVRGTGISTATVTPPGGSPLALQPFPDGRLCKRDFFSDSDDLDLAYPDGLYVFAFSGAGATDSKTLDFQQTEPGGYLEFVSPPASSTVLPGVDLDFSWSLVEKSNGVGCIAAMTCADEIVAQISTFQITGTLSVLDELLPITATGAPLSGSLLDDGHEYDMLVATSVGALNPSDMTDMGDPTTTIAAYRDVNRGSFLALPEGPASLLGLAALVALGAVKRRRCGSR